MIEDRKRCKCGILIWISPDGTASTTCPTCRPEVDRTNAQVLPAIITSSPHTQILKTSDIGVGDLQDLMQKSCAPIIRRSRTFNEWLLSVDIEEKQLAEKAKTSAAALALLRGRTEMVQNMRALVLATRDLEDVEIEAEKRRRALAIEFLQLESNRLHIEEEIERHHATRRMRVETERLREEQRQDAMRPKTVNQPKPDTDDDRARRRAEAVRRQAMVADFVTEVAAAFAADVGNSEKALRIRAILEVYDREVGDLPREIANFMNEMEGGDRG